MQPITILLGPPPAGVEPLAVVTDVEAVYRIIRGSLVHRDDINDHYRGEVALVYGDSGEVVLHYRLTKHLRG